MRESKGVFFTLAVVGLAMAGAGAGIQISTSKQASAAEDLQEMPGLIHSMAGPDLFRAYCATCHGLDGKGNGPAAAALKIKPPDLTTLASSNGGQFPVTAVRSTITGENVPMSHGSREMPIWGPVFHQIEVDVDRGHVRLENLVQYLESIQTVDKMGDKSKPANRISEQSNPLTGAELFKQHCAVCHIDDAAVNNAPVPSPFRQPPDLSALTQRYGGKFPESYVEEVLRDGVEMPAHGPAEMPIWGADFMARDKLTEKQVGLRIAKLTEYLRSIQK
jgi:mono/diheme cytochrome c family protein